MSRSGNQQAKAVLVISREPLVQRQLRRVLRRRDLEVHLATSLSAGLDIAARTPIRAVIAHHHRRYVDGAEVVWAFAEHHPRAWCILMNSMLSERVLQRALSGGMYAFLPMPYELPTLYALIKDAMEEPRPAGYPEHLRRPELRRLWGRSEPMLRLVAAIKKRAKNHGNTVIHGPPGTRRTLVARALHESALGPRARFEVLDLGAENPDLDLELSGCERGVFSKVRDGVTGIFERNRGGTVFLDRIEAAPQLAEKVARSVILHSNIRLIGSLEPTPVKVRLILGSSVDEDHESLSFLTALPKSERLYVPGLNARRADMRFIINAMTHPAYFSKEALAAIGQRDWSRGNDALLKDVVERTLTKLASPQTWQLRIEPEHLA